MSKILVVNPAAVEMTQLREAFREEPFYEFYVAAGVEQLKYYHDLFKDQIDLILLSCGPEKNEAGLSQTIDFFEEVKIAWPDTRILLFCRDKLFLDEISVRLSGKIYGTMNFSGKTGLKAPEIFQKIKSSLTPKKEPAPEGRIPALLIVDDDESILKTLPLLLKTVGFERIWTASKTSDAILILNDNLKIIDVALVDYNLAQEKADYLIKRIKEMSPALKVFMMTGEGKDKKAPWPKDTDRLLSGVLYKPFYDIEEMVKTINNVLQQETAIAKSRQKKILIIDDSPETGQILTNVFGSEFILDSAPDGEEGLKKFREDQPDLVVLDYRMPGQNGLEVFRTLKEIFPDVRVIAVTIENNPAVTLEFLRLGAMAVVPKPIDVEKLESIIRNQLQ